MPYYFCSIISHGTCHRKRAWQAQTSSIRNELGVVRTVSKGIKSGTHDVGPCRPRLEDERWEQAELSYSAGEKHSTAGLVKRCGRVRVKTRSAWCGQSPTGGNCCKQMSHFSPLKWYKSNKSYCSISKCHFPLKEPGLGQESTR